MSNGMFANLVWGWRLDREDPVFRAWLDDRRMAVGRLSKLCTEMRDLDLSLNDGLEFDASRYRDVDGLGSFADHDWLERNLTDGDISDIKVLVEACIAVQRLDRCLVAILVAARQLPVGAMDLLRLVAVSDDAVSDDVEAGDVMVGVGMMVLVNFVLDNPELTRDMSAKKADYYSWVT